MPAGEGHSTARLALVTGASRGLGAELTRQLAAMGIHCIVTARTVGALEALDDEVRKAGGHPLTIVPFDLEKNIDAIDALGAELHQRYGRLDFFFANAATLGVLTPAAHLEPKTWQQVMTVNATANYRFIRSLDPLLRQSEAARAVFITCSQGSMAEAYWGGFAASKAALERFAQCYALETAKTNISVDIIDPGPMPTRLRATAFPGLQDQNPLALTSAAGCVLGRLGLTGATSGSADISAPYPAPHGRKQG
ncbi:MAG: SDR family NAD(P)-dependent oxidoreductase [Alphaproteobacteria bacterium]|nr:SDR family NAD(P)-dependent oxidoreductase [Alphaproteobacteria bacterium]